MHFTSHGHQEPTSFTPGDTRWALVPLVTGNPWSQLPNSHQVRGHAPWANKRTGATKHAGTQTHGWSPGGLSLIPPAPRPPQHRSHHTSKIPSFGHWILSNRVSLVKKPAVGSGFHTTGRGPAPTVGGSVPRALELPARVCPGGQGWPREGAHHPHACQGSPVRLEMG